MLKSKVLRLMSVVLFALCFAIPVTAQVIVPPGATDTGLGGGNAITGMILLSTGQRLERRVSVRIQTMTRGHRVAMSDEYGKFTFQGRVSGDYTIVINKEKDFEPFSQVVSIIQPRGFPPQNYNVNIRLVIKSGGAGKPGVVNADTAGVPKHAMELYNKAIELAKTGDRLGAIEQLKSAITEYPGFMLAYNEMGVQYLKIGQPDKAIEVLSASLRIKPDDFTPRLNYGIALLEKREAAESEAQLRLALKKNDSSSTAHMYLGLALLNLSKNGKTRQFDAARYAEAQKELERAVSLGKNEVAMAHRYLGGIYAGNKDYKRGADELETYLKLSPKARDAETIRGLIKDLRSKNK